MLINTHHARAVVTDEIIAYHSLFIILRALHADSMLELRCYCQEREDATAEEKEANDALSNNVVDECKQAFEGEGVNAIATAKKKRDTVFEAHSV